MTKKVLIVFFLLGLNIGISVHRHLFIFHVLLLLTMIILMFLIEAEKNKWFKGKYWCKIIDHAQENFTIDYTTYDSPIDIHCIRCKKILFSYPTITRKLHQTWLEREYNKIRNSNETSL